jgi:LAGLIDADG endonuclease
MNDKRVNFLISENNINITINYLLGLIEGDGSFYFNKTDNTVRISLIMIKNNRIVLEKIKEFLLKNLDENSLFLAKHTKLIYINNKAIITNRKEMTSLDISQLDYICNKLLPVFDKLNFRTKKYLDYLAFKRIAFLLLDGKHLSVKGKIIIDKFADTMNNSRLSTKLKDNLTNFSELEINMKLLEKADSLIQNYPDGPALSLVNKN